MTAQALADRVGLSPSPCLRRIRIMEEKGIIRGYVALVDQKKVESRGTGLLPVTTSAVKVLEADGSSIPQWVAAMRLIPLALPYPQTASWRVADKILADGFQAYFASFPNASLTDVFKTIDSTIADLPK